MHGRGVWAVRDGEGDADDSRRLHCRSVCLMAVEGARWAMMDDEEVVMEMVVAYSSIVNEVVLRGCLSAAGPVGREFTRSAAMTSPTSPFDACDFDATASPALFFSSSLQQYTSHSKDTQPTDISTLSTSSLTSPLSCLPPGETHPQDRHPSDRTKRQPTTSTFP